MSDRPHCADALETADSVPVDQSLSAADAAAAAAAAAADKKKRRWKAKKEFPKPKLPTSGYAATTTTPTPNNAAPTPASRAKRAPEGKRNPPVPRAQGAVKGGQRVPAAAGAQAA